MALRDGTTWLDWTQRNRWIWALAGVVLLWLVLARQEARSAGTRVDLRTSWPVVRRFGLGLVAYAVAIGVAFVNAYLALAVHGALALYYSFDQLRA